MSLSLIVVLLLTLVAEFANGLTDAPNAIAAVISTRVLTPIRAVFMAATMNLVGALTTGTAVAATIGTGIVRPEAIGLHTVAATLLAIITWTTLAWRLGLPTSETHEMLAGLAGAGLAAAGTSVLLWAGWQKVLIGLALSTVFGSLSGFLLMSLIYALFRRASSSYAKKVFGRLQLISSSFLAFSHGSNDGQKFMGIFALALVLGGVLPEFRVPVWVILLCGLVMGLGTMFGGWRIIKTMGFRITRLEPPNGFAAESSASLAILLASSFGIPLSTTHTINMAIVGVGSTRRFSAVRWGTTRQIVIAWILTFPGCAVLGYVFALLLEPLLG